MLNRKSARALFGVGLAFFGNHAGGAPLQTFDLICSSTTGAPIHFRFDLHQRKWCSGPCNSVWHIDELSDAMIRVSIRSSDHMHDWNVFLNRYSATYSAVHIGFGNAPADQGRCSVKTFSGFPVQQF